MAEEKRPLSHLYCKIYYARFRKDGVWLLHSLRQAIMQGAVVLFISIGMVFAAPVYAQQPLMTMEEIRPGMTGIGKTVIKGTEIENFDVEVLSILKQKGPTGDKILVKVSGDVIDKTGGIAAGMSGSPVYIDGKLIGAISYGWAMTDRTIGMVTPIQEMLALWELDAGNTDGARLNKEKGNLPALATPLMVSGLGQRAMGKLTEQLKPFDLVPVSAGTAVGITEAAVELEPGSAMGVQLMRGDIDMTAIGTVTYREGNKLLGFGHPFLKRGSVDYFMTTAYIHQTIPSLDTSFKLGAPLDLAGTIKQDRGTGILGMIGRYPHNVPLRVRVKDLDTNKENELFVRVIPDEQLVPALVTTAAMQAIEQTIDRTGIGTSWVKMEILGRNLPGDKIVRENMFFHPTDVGAGSLGELLEGLAIILNNPFTTVEIMDVKLDVVVEKEIRVATIEQVQAKKVTAKPGDTIPISVTLKPFRGESIQETVNFTIPAHQAPGPLAVMVRGGGSTPPLQKLLAQLKAQDTSADGPKNLAEHLKEFIQRDRNNELVAEIMPFGLVNDPALLLGGEVPLASYNSPRTPLPPQQSANAGKIASEKAPQAAKVITDYLIDGNAGLYIQVEGKTETVPDKGQKP